MEITRTYKFPLMPRVGERRRLARTAGACRWFRNQLIADNKTRFEAGEKYDRKRGYQMRTELRGNINWFCAVSADAQGQAARALNGDFVAAFKGQKGFPRFSAKGITPDYFRVDAGKCPIYNNRIRLPNIGLVRMRMHLPLPDGKQGTVNVTRDGDRWFVCIPFTFEKDAPMHNGEPVGLDVGIKKTAAASDGTLYRISQHYAERNQKRHAARKRRYERAMARKREAALRREVGWDGKSETRGQAEKRLKELRAQQNEGKSWKKRKPRYSRRYEIAQQRHAKASHKIRDCRHNALHHLSKAVAVKHGFIAMEDLKLLNMTASAKGDADNPGRNVRTKAALNRALLAAGLGMLRTMIIYKVEERGGKVKLVDPKNTSRTCPKCGMVAAENRKREAFKCVACGYEADADVNAAVNILTAGLVDAALEKSKAVARRDGGGVARPVKRESPALSNT